MSDLGPRPTWPDVVVEQPLTQTAPDRGRTQHTIRGARRYDGILSLFGALSSEYRAAAERYRDRQCHCGRRGGLTERSMVRSRSPTAHEPSAAVLDALERVRAASDAMGKRAMPVVIWCVLGNQSLASYERTRRTRHGAPAATLRLALAALADHLRPGGWAIGWIEKGQGESRRPARGSTSPIPAGRRTGRTPHTTSRAATTHTWRATPLTSGNDRDSG